MKKIEKLTPEEEAYSPKKHSENVGSRSEYDFEGALLALKKSWVPRRGMLHLDTESATFFVGEYEEAIQAALKMAVTGGWKPIESAPKDELVMVWERGQSWWGINSRTCAKMTETIPSGPYRWTVAFGENQKPATPTHWQPLPQPPKESER
jgi:hypothetical protein